MNHIQKTKRRLTLTFLWVILGIIILLGLSFFTFRFFDGYRRDSNESKVVKVQDREVFEQLLNNEAFKNIPKPKFAPRGGKFEKRAPLPFVVRFNSWGSIIDKDFWAEYEWEELIQELYIHKDEESFQSSHGMGQFYSSVDGGKILVFKPFRYPFFEYLEDVSLFLLFTLIFSIPLYFAIKLFVDKTLVPVEENLRDMEDFVHNAGHELKTPLAVVDGDLQLLKARKNYSEESVDEMRSEIQKLNTLIEGLVDMANIQATKEKEKLSINEELQQVLKTYESALEEKNIQIHIEWKTKIFVMANKGYVQILLGNLISNAIKYNIDSGKVVCTFRKDTLTIEDTGDGIDEEHHSKIWQRFYKVAGKKSGNGIGLSLVKKIVDMYHWEVKIESKKWHYTKFTISFA